MKIKISETKKREDNFIDETIVEKPVVKEENSLMSARKNLSKNSNVSIYSSDPGPTGMGSTGQGYVDINQYQIVSQKYIPNYQYFVQGPNFFSNDEGDCVRVAVEILLGYNNWANDGRLIEGKYLFGDEEQRKKPYEKAGLGTNEKFAPVLENYLRNDGKELWLGEVPLAIELYLVNEGAKNSLLGSSAYNFISVGNIIKGAVDIGDPLIVGIYSYTSDTGENLKEKHAVVVYGYQTIKVNGQNIEGYISHFGWDDGTQNVWFNSSWVIDCLTFTTSHIHANEIPISITNQNEQHVTQCETCGRYKVNSNHLVQEKERIVTSIAGAAETTFNPYLHYEVCYCGYRTSVGHEYK